MDRLVLINDQQVTTLVGSIGFLEIVLGGEAVDEGVATGPESS